MRKNNIFLLGISLLMITCSKDEDNNLQPLPDTPDTLLIEYPGLMHIRSTDYTTVNSSLMLQDDEPAEIMFSNDRKFMINRPMIVGVTSNQELRVRFFSARSVLKVKIYAPLPGGGRFKLATYDSIPAFGESHFPLPVIKTGDKLILESGDSILVTVPFVLSEKDTLQILCEDDYYQKVTTHNKCQWLLQFYSYEGEGWYSKRIKPVHAREAIACLSNMGYMLSSEEFVTGHLRLQGRIYDDKGPGNWVNMKTLLDRIYAYRWIQIAHVTQVLGLAGRGFLGLSEHCWFGHYHDTTQGDASSTAFHEFAHVLGYNHGTNMTEGTVDFTLWPRTCQQLYKQMCIREELPVWSSTFLKSKYCKNSYYYDEHERP